MTATAALTINCKGRLLSLEEAKVMAILNVTPDSFYDGGQHHLHETAVAKALQYLSEGAAIIDIGGQSTRPGAERVSEAEELQRVIPVIELLLKAAPDTLIAVDTYRAAVAKTAVEAGACMVNDISAGTLDSMLLPTVAQLQVPYVLMHMQGTPETMQLAPDYDNVVTAVYDFFSKQVAALKEMGITDIILDPGFGFGKTVAHNYQLVAALPLFTKLGFPLLAGISRKSMITKVLNITPAEALNGSTVLHTIALQNGAKLLRVHDVKPALEAIRLVQIYQDAVY